MDLWEEAARIAMIFREYEQSVEYQKKAMALKQATDTDQNLNNIGLACYEQGNYNEALNHLNQSLKKNPHNYHA